MELGFISWSDQYLVQATTLHGDRKSLVVVMEGRELWADTYIKVLRQDKKLIGVSAYDFILHKDYSHGGRFFDITIEETDKVISPQAHRKQALVQASNRDEAVDMLQDCLTYLIEHSHVRPKTRWEITQTLESDIDMVTLGWCFNSRLGVTTCGPTVHSTDGEPYRMQDVLDDSGYMVYWEDIRCKKICRGRCCASMS